MSRIEMQSETLASGVKVVRPVGKLDVFSFIDFKKYFEDLCAEAQGLMVVVDLSRVDYIASSGWSVLLSRRQAIRRQGGDLSVACLNENLRRVYDTMLIEKMLPAGQTVETAALLLKA